MLALVLLGGARPALADPPPIVTAPTSAEITASSATLGGTVADPFNLGVDGRGVVYALTSVNTNPIIGGSGVTQVPASGMSGVFTVPVSGLTPGTGYTFRAYAINIGGTRYTIASAFTTCLTNITVLNTNDAGPGSLRQAIVDLCPGGTITFTNSLSGSTIGLTSGELEIDKSLTLLGLGATNLAVSGNNLSRVFVIAQGVSASLSGLKITGGNAGGGDGGAIKNDRGRLTLDGCVVSDSAGGYGGGIFTDARGGGAWLVLTHCTVRNNHATVNGGGLAVYGGTNEIVASTFASNRCDFAGGGVYAERSSYSIVNSTFSSNLSTNSGSGEGGGIFFEFGAAAIRHTTFAGNAAPSDTAGGIFNHLGGVAVRHSLFAAGASGVNLAGNGSITSLGFNLSDDDSRNIINARYLDQPTDRNNLPALLGPLADHGGPTPTHALLPGSPAFNAGDPAFATNSLPFDQRGPGFPRVVNGQLDIGALEAQTAPPAFTLCPGSVMTNVANATNIVAVTWPDPTATGTPAPDIRCAPPSGTTFAVGVTTVTCTATNLAGTNDCTFTVTVCAPNITVTSTDDSGPGTLRAAIELANDCPGTNTIRFNVTGTIVLTSELPQLSDPVFILGPGPTNLTVTRSGDSDTRCFPIFYMNDSDIVWISGLTISNGCDSFGGGGVFNTGFGVLSNCVVTRNYSGNYGGGVYNETEMIVSDCSFLDNVAGRAGGGLYNCSDRLIIERTVFDPNIAENGGALAVAGGDVLLTNVTFSGNLATNGGAIHLRNFNSFVCASVTIASNTAVAAGGGIYDDRNGDGALKNTIVAGNRAPGTPDVFGALVSLGHNLIGAQGTNTAGFTNGVMGDQVGTSGNPINPVLGPLQNNGGPTVTHALLPGSPALDTGTNDLAPPTDQRGAGFARIINGVIDIGAFEAPTCRLAASPFASPAVCVGSPAAFCTVVTGAGRDSFSTDFASGPPAGTTLYGDASIGDDGSGTNQVLHLTDAFRNSSFGAINIPDPAGGANVTQLSVHWRSLVGGGSGADGYSFNWASDLPGTPTFANPGEEGAGSGLSVTVDTFDNGSDEAGPGGSGIEIKWQTNRVAFASVPNDSPGTGPYLRKNQFVDACVTVSSNGVATFIYDGVALSANLPGFTGIAGGRFQFGARTGGAADNHWIDDVTIAGAGANACPVSFTWRKGGQVIAGQTNSYLALTNVTSASAGDYCVIARGPVNAVTNCAHLTVNSNCGPTVVSCVAGAVYLPLCGHGTDTHALWLPGIGTDFEFIPDVGLFTEFPDGTATITGTVSRRSDTNQAFDVSMTLSGRTTNTPSGSPKKQLCDMAYVEKGGPIDPSTWRYYPNFSGVLTGVGSYSGAIMNISGVGGAFQVGAGASGKNFDFGASAWFTWVVIQPPTSGRLQRTGQGDVNIDIFDCGGEGEGEGGGPFRFLAQPECFVHYAFEEPAGLNALDTSGSGKHGVLLNGPARTNGVIGKAVRFDGVNDRVSATNATSLNVTSAFTVACWVKPESVSSSTYFVIKGNDSSDRFAYALRASSAKVQYRWVSHAGVKSTFGTTASVLAAGRWTHVAVAHTPGSLPVLFINGAVVPGSLSGGSATALVGMSSNAFSVGASADGKGLFKGAIDEVFVCASALVAAQIQNLTNGLPPGPPPPPPVPGIATASPLPSGQVGVPYSQTLVATGGTPGFKWSVFTGALPTGLTLNTNTGAITGTPSSATTNQLTIRLADAMAQTADQEFLLAITNAPPAPSAGSTAGLVQWKFDEASGLVALDSTGSGNLGALLNDPTRVTGQVSPGALRFDGSNDRVAATNATSLNVTGALTVAAWVKPESVLGTRYVLIKGSQSGAAYSYALRASDAKMQYRWVSAGGVENKFATTAGVLTIGRWLHVAAVHTPGSLPVLYINGVVAPGSLGTGSAAAPRLPSPNPFTVGASSDGSDLFQGAIDEVVVCASALTPTQIQGLMNGTLPAPPAPSPLPVGGSLPIHLALQTSGDLARLSWSSVPGQTYRVQYKNQLDDADWLDLTGNFYAVDANSAVEDDLSSQSQRFYRVVLLP